MVPLLYSDSVGAPAGSGPAHLTEHLSAYILDSASELNPSLMRSSKVINHFNTINNIKRFSFFLISPVLLYHSDSVTF